MTDPAEMMLVTNRDLTGRTRFTQVSLFSVLLSGRYDGVIAVGELKKLGNMAIATMDPAAQSSASPVLSPPFQG